jgi:hypothetical protein
LQISSQVDLFTPLFISDLEKIPFFGERIIKASTSLPNARAGDVESIMPPLLVPLAPERNYFLFGEVL